MEKLKLLNEFLKTVLTAVLALAVLYMVQVPGTLLNTQKTSEEIRRERAKLLIDLILIEDFEQRELALAAIRLAYEDEGDRVFSGFENLISIQSKIENVTSLVNNIDQDSILKSAECDELASQLVEIRNRTEEFMSAANMELMGFGESGIAGVGPRHNFWLQKVDSSLKQAESVSQVLETKCKD